jgi:sialate O-acetylesterase
MKYFLYNLIKLKMKLTYLKTQTIIKSLFLLVLFIPVLSFSEVRLPKLVSNGMVLQRDTELKIWGWAAGGEKISVQFMNSTYQTTANANGEWQVTLPKMKAGGPFEMKIDGTNTIIISDILIGDVWVCSGQSNMQSSLRSLTSIYQDEIDKAENPYIRHFSVGSGFKLGETEVDFRSGSWLSATPANVMRFSAVAYFFAKKLYDEYKIPIGLINASVGGSSAEAWISEEGMKNFPRYYKEAQKYQLPGFMEKVNKQDSERAANWNNYVRENDNGHKGPLKWSDPAFDDSNWETMRVPGYWINTKTGNVNGVVWFRKKINVLANMTGKPAILKVGRIADSDSVFINGKFVGAVNSLYALRSYTIPDSLLIAGLNTVVVKITSYIHNGGFVPGRPYQLITGSDIINLEGDWKYKVGVAAEPLEDRLFTGKIPTGLFNGMIAPMLNFAIKGVVWYQGESNTIRAFEHFEIFKALIKDWRTNWRLGDFPFLYVQLPNFVEENFETTKYDWAVFRETQLKALNIPNTGMAVTIDVGEFNDIHPVQKKPVGDRLALAALKIAYGDNNIIYSGPVYTSMKINGREITLSFDHIGKGLISKDGEELNCFEICGKDNNWISAKTKIENDKVVVWSENVTNPVAVRYAWANNPEGINFFNSEGLPASPFRTSTLY